MAKSSKSEHSYDKSNQNCARNYKAELLKEGEIPKEQATSTTEGSDATTENTHTHFSVSLPHFIKPPDLGWVHVISGQVDDVINWEADEHDDRDGFSGTKLLAIQMENSHNAHDYNRHTIDGNNALDKVTRGIEQNYERENDGDDYALDCVQNQGIFSCDTRP